MNRKEKIAFLNGLRKGQNKISELNPNKINCFLISIGDRHYYKGRTITEEEYQSLHPEWMKTIYIGFDEYEVNL